MVKVDGTISSQKMYSVYIYIMMSVELSNKVITKTWPQKASNGG